MSLGQPGPITDELAPLKPHNSIKKSKFSKFLQGCSLCILVIFLLASLFAGIPYGYEGINLVILVATFMHFMLFPFLFYGLVGLIFVCIPDQSFEELVPWFWKMILYLAIICFIVVSLSELAHYLGIYTAHPAVQWK